MTQRWRRRASRWETVGAATLKEWSRAAVSWDRRTINFWDDADLGAFESRRQLSVNCPWCDDIWLKLQQQP